MTAGSLIDCGEGVRLERGVRCRMSDGVELVSDHYYPPGPGPNPTLLMRQPYGRAIASTVVYAHPIWFARHGYNVVIQDVRGRGDSEGDFYPFRQEGRDGGETIAWLRTRPESNGHVGMYGFSYQGMTQLLAAAEQPEGLVCIAPGMTAHDLFQGWFYHQGALRFASALGWGLQILKEDARRLELREASDRLEQAWANLAAQTGVLPFGAHPAIHGENVPGYVRDWFEHDEPSEYWSSLDVSQSAQKINVPALHVSGWYDMFLRGSVAGFLTLTSGAATPHARESQYLIAGPWIHIPWGDRIGTADFGADALLDTDAILLRWFNHWLKDSGEFASEPKIRHFVLGENRWRTADAWPGRAKYALYLHSEGKANSRKGDGLLLASAASHFATSRRLRLRSRSSGPRAGRANRRQRTIRPGRARTWQQSSRLHHRTPRRAAAHFWYAACCALLFHIVGLYRFHREARSCEAHWRGGIHLHRHGAVELALCRVRLRRRQGSPLGIQPRTHLLLLRSGRMHSSRNRQQCVSSV